MKPQVDKNHYFTEFYDKKERFASYWHQINEIIKLNPKSVLEIGIGNKFVSKYIKERQFNVISLDIDERLNPDVVGNVLDIPFPDLSFDVITCYELLEHLPYENFHKALSEIFRVSCFCALISLPDMNRVSRFSMQIPMLGEFRVLIPLPRIRKKFDEQHYWEIGGNGYSLSKITTDIQRVGFHIERTYRVFEFPYHRLFILRKRVD